MKPHDRRSKESFRVFSRTLSRFFAIGAFILGLTFLLGVSQASAAALLLYPDPLEIPEGGTGILEVRLDTEGEAVNAAEVVLAFPPGVLVVREVLTGGSVLPLQPEPAFLGIDTVKIIGGAPSGFSGSGVFARVVFGAQEGAAVSSATISFDEKTRVLLNDGKATPARLSVRSAEVRRVAQGTIALSSPSHPDDTTWYQSRTIIMHWEREEGVAYSYQLSREPATIPDEISDEPAGDIKLEAEEDGIFYFSLRKIAQNDAEADAEQRRIARFRIMVDATPPETFEVFVSKNKDVFEGDLWYAAFFPQDIVSGIAKIEVAEVHGDEEPRWVEAASPYALRDQSRRSTLYVRATDRAGNAQEVIVPPSGIRFPWWVWVALSVLLISIFAVVQKRRLQREQRYDIIKE